jgi:hypothetical protein
LGASPINCSRGVARGPQQGISTTGVADLRAEHNTQKLKIACYAACAHNRATITANP